MVLYGCYEQQEQVLQGIGMIIDQFNIYSGLLANIAIDHSCSDNWVNKIDIDRTWPTIIRLNILFTIKL